MSSGNSHFGRRAAVAHSMRMFYLGFGECTEVADSNRSCEEERADDEVLYCATESLAHMVDGSQVLLWVLSTFGKVGEAMLIRIHVIVLERKKVTHNLNSSFIQFGVNEEFSSDKRKVEGQAT